MPYLSFDASKKATPVAIVKGGKDKNKILYVHDEKAPEGSTAKIELSDDSKFVPLPYVDPEKRMIAYIAGVSGSGKSWMARQIAENYRKLHPHKGVYLVSQLEKDETLDNMEGGAPGRISLDSLVEDFPKLEELEDCLIIFDDYDTLPKQYLATVMRLIDMICIEGRHTRTSVLILTHFLSNFNKTRLQLAESQVLCLYPNATSPKAMLNVCQNYAGLDKPQVMALKKCGSRWVWIHKHFPPFVITEHFASML
jgi:hypothetical protein